ncbi:MAG: hypothetical protein WCP57_04160 [Bacteroidota bacterium]
MKKIIILSYFFTPCNLTASSRPGSWATYLPKYGYYPIIITRFWSGKELTEYQRLAPTEDKVHIVQNHDAEIHYLPYKSSFRDRCFIKSEHQSIYKFISKLITTLYLLLQNYSIRFIPFNNLYHYADDYIKKNPDIAYLIISGNPFEQFFLGYLLKKKYPSLKWIADYRDEWTTSEIITFTGIRRLLWKSQQYFEKKWISNTDLITANTEYATKKLAAFHHKKTKKVLNGFDPKEIAEMAKYQPKSSKNELVIVHNGTLYETQDITVFIEALNQINPPEGFNIKFKCPGIKIKKDMAAWVEKLLTNPRIELLLTDRIPKTEILQMQMDADLLLMVAHKNKKGIIGSKLYEYIALNKPVLLCPSDHDELESTLEQANLGYICNNVAETKTCIESLIKQKQQNSSIFTSPNTEAIQMYSRENQTKLLASYLLELDSNE